MWRLKIKQETGRKLVGRLDNQLSTQFQGYQLHSEKLGDVAALAPLSEGYVAMVAPRLKDSECIITIIITSSRFFFKKKGKEIERKSRK